MQALYETIDNGQIGLFESPTGAAAMTMLLLAYTFKAKSSKHARESYQGRLCAGTGKTLSLICSSLQWLKDQHALEAAEAQAAKSSAAGANTCLSSTPHNRSQMSQSESPLYALST